MQFKTSTAALRDANSRILIDLAKKDSRIVVLDSDLLNASGLAAFNKEFPGRTFNCGIQEANMAGAAGGLSSMGLIPVIHSFASFASRRMTDQVFMSGVYAEQNIKILGTDPGAANSANGGTHMALEDTGIMRSMPDITIVSPTDETMLESILPGIIETYGMFYIRLVRKSSIVVYEAGTNFTLGKAHIARPGTDITIIAEGAIMVPEALKAADRLEQLGISARVLDMFTIKPLDREAVISAARETGAVLTAENHNILNGLGSAVAEVLAEERLAVPFGRIGFRDVLGQTGTVPYILETYGMDAAHITEAAKKLVSEKVQAGSRI
ncbi:transketolase family protein [Breznakiella homolactica]|uniref:Transketolase family protein n=1 Tax=Breznakiella homolactica TaxID=2798577 RepID=A0A7T8BC41_9SPIR|nr:transketolase C-terminal domain-containing protein [Breznakiella homolactica]QQO11046.1 transketolase family protein [Breznakiella homolactica]